MNTIDLHLPLPNIGHRCMCLLVDAIYILAIIVTALLIIFFPIIGFAIVFFKYIVTGQYGLLRIAAQIYVFWMLRDAILGGDYGGCC